MGGFFMGSKTKLKMHVDFSMATLLVNIRYTNADKEDCLVKAGTRIVVNIARNIGCAGGDDHFEVYPDQYQVEYRLAC